MIRFNGSKKNFISASRWPCTPTFLVPHSKRHMTRRGAHDGHKHDIYLISLLWLMYPVLLSTSTPISSTVHCSLDRFQVVFTSTDIASVIFTDNLWNCSKQVSNHFRVSFSFLGVLCILTSESCVASFSVSDFMGGSTVWIVSSIFPITEEKSDTAPNTSLGFCGEYNVATKSSTAESNSWDLCGRSSREMSRVVILLLALRISS